VITTGFARLTDGGLVAVTEAAGAAGAAGAGPSRGQGGGQGGGQGRRDGPPAPAP
jgi:hypothetical protein